MPPHFHDDVTRSDDDVTRSDDDAACLKVADAAIALIQLPPTLTPAGDGPSFIGGRLDPILIGDVNVLSWTTINVQISFCSSPFLSLSFSLSLSPTRHFSHPRSLDCSLYRCIHLHISLFRFHTYTHSTPPVRMCVHQRRTVHASTTRTVSSACHGVKTSRTSPCADGNA